MTRIGFLMTRLRPEEKLLLEELARRPNVEIVRILDGETYFDISKPSWEVDVLFERSISYSRWPLHLAHLRGAGCARHQSVHDRRTLRR